MALLDVVRSLEGLSDAKRRLRIQEYLDARQVRYVRHRYFFGENIIVPSSKQVEVGLGSHFDAVFGSPGANDDASAVAVLLDLMQRVAQAPPKRLGVRYFFFDDEEWGLRGSRAYLRKHGKAGLVGLYNLELVGAGDRLALWPVSKTAQSPLLFALEAEATARRTNASRFDRIVSNSADHVSFCKAGVSDAFTLTMISEDDAKVGNEYNRALAEGAGFTRLRTILRSAPLFAHYHRPSDLSKYLSEDSLQAVSDILYGAIHRLDSLWAQQEK